MERIRAKVLLAAATASSLAMAWISPAQADPYTVTTSCSNPYTGSQAGPTAFDVQIPATATVGQAVPVSVAFTFTNASGFNIDDVNNIRQNIATTGTGQNPVTVTAGSQGPVPNGANLTVTQTGTWTPDVAGTATFTLGDFLFDTIAFGLTIPITCTFTSAAPSLSSVVAPPPDTTAPTGSFTLSPTSPWIGQGTKLTQQNVADNGESDPATVTRAVTWGDGTSTTLTAGQGPVTKTYAATGTYTVTFTLTDAAGNATVQSGTVTVVNPGRFKLSKAAVWHHEAVKVTLSAVPAGTTKIVLSYGDGYRSTLKGKNQTVAHSYHYRSNGKLMPVGSVSLTAVYTNKYGSTTSLPVGKVTIKKDSWRPKVTITKPKHPERVKSWKTIRGTASDKGSGVQGVTVVVTRTVGRTSYCYTTGRTWMKLTASSNYDRCVLERTTKKGKWSLSVKGLKKGTLAVYAVSADWADQASKPAKVTRRLTR